MNGRLLALTSLAMIAFAGNSLLCRIALLAEPLTLRLTFASVSILGGIALVILNNPQARRN